MTKKTAAESHGWTDVHGGPEEGGVYWRGINPETKRMEEIPDLRTEPYKLWDHFANQRCKGKQLRPEDIKVLAMISMETFIEYATSYFKQ